MIARHCGLLSRAMFYLKGAKSNRMMEEIRDYYKVVREWNDKKGKKEDCMEFLMKRSADFKE